MTLDSPKAKKQYEAQDGWVQKAFGPQARLSKATYPIAIKGQKVSDLHEVIEASLMEELKEQFTTIDRVKIWRLKDTTYIRARVLMAVYNVEEANKAYKEGVFWRYQQLFYEPYISEIRPI